MVMNKDDFEFNFFISSQFKYYIELTPDDAHHAANLDENHFLYEYCEDVDECHTFWLIDIRGTDGFHVRDMPTD